MMDWTDRHCRAFHRVLTQRARLYTEMLTTGAVIHGDRGKLLGFDPCEHPVALQLGGSEPQALAEAARIGEGFGYDEINLNCGCPSDRVQEGRFGACLMAEPALVARCVAAMRRAVSVPVTVKCRIGIDDQDAEAGLSGFVHAIADEGVATVIVHARKAWLKGLSPKENREIPPLDYDRVLRLKAEFPDLTVVINGGIDTLDEAASLLERVDGVMLGRAAYRRPYILAEVDRLFFAATQAPLTRTEALERFIPYVEAQLAHGVRLHAITRHVLGLYHGAPRGRLFRRILSEGGGLSDAGLHVLGEAVRAGAPAQAEGRTGAAA